MNKRLLASTVGLALVNAIATAAADPFPLAASAPDTTATEDTAPFLLSDGLSQTLIANRDTLTAAGLPATFGNWDMSAFSRSGRSIFVPAEVGSGAGVFRYDVKKGTFRVLMEGNNTGVREADPALFDATNDDFSRLDPATYTPFGTVLTGEETTGGRLFEILNPNSRHRPIHVRWLSKVPAVGHEGLRFDSKGNMYFVDENKSGSVYKYVPRRKGDLGVGQTFVLSVDAFAGVASENWDSLANSAQPRAGKARWVPITDKHGNALTAADPFVFVTATGGRDAADEVNGTPYGRPEDITFNRLASEKKGYHGHRKDSRLARRHEHDRRNRDERGNEAFYFTATSEHTVYSVELLSDSKAMVRVFANRDTIDLATGAAVGSGLRSPDNLATGADGTIYIIEDNNPGDIWKAIDADRDGVAESIGRWASLGVAGSEPTGLEQDPKDPRRFIVNVQHPSSGNDALWEIRLP